MIIEIERQDKHEKEGLKNSIRRMFKKLIKDIYSWNLYTTQTGPGHSQKDA